jgi:hypothetical protein
MIVNLNETNTIELEILESNLKPNCFHIIHSVLEGDNRAGGWSSNKIITIKTLSEVSRFKNNNKIRILDVKPAYEFSFQFEKSVTNEDIEQAIQELSNQNEIKTRLKEIEKAERLISRNKKVIDNKS